MIGDIKSIYKYLETQKEDTDTLYEIKKLRKKSARTLAQNKYYFGVVIPIIADYIGLKWDYEKMELHEQLKKQFGLETTTGLDTAEFSFMVGEIRAWFLEHRNLYIPEPNEAENLASLDNYLN